MTTTRQAQPAVATAVGVAITIEQTIGSIGDLRIRLAGELDRWSAPVLAQALAALRPPTRPAGERASQLVLDLRRLSFLDIGGLSALEDTRRALLEAGWIVTVGPAQPQVGQLLRFADRAGWLLDGPLLAEQPATPRLHVVRAAGPLRR